MYKMFITPYNFISMSEFLQVHSQFFLLLITLCTVIKILYLENRVYKLESELEYIHCMIQEQEDDEEEEEETSSESDDSQDEDYEPTAENEKEEN